MMQNAGLLLKKRQVRRCERAEKVVFHLLLGDLPLNGVRFGAKRSAFWCKIDCVLLQNARRNAAKCSAICR